MSISTNIHDGEKIILSASSISPPHGRVAMLQFFVETLRNGGASDRVEITTFMNDPACLEKLQRATAAFNAIMAEEPAKEDAEAA